MLPWDQDFVEVIPEVLFIAQLLSVISKILRGGDIEAPADGVCVVDVFPVLPGLLAHA